jgi:hypothetical protein
MRTLQELLVQTKTSSVETLMSAIKDEILLGSD